MLKIGLTGGIGSGKSTVSSILSANNISIIDADVVSRNVLNKYPGIMTEVKKQFGKSFFDLNGKFRRREFGNFIFSNKDLRKKYEDIIIPYIKEEILSIMKEFQDKGEFMCVLDAPTLIENGFNDFMDEVILVWVDLDTQVKRVMERDKFDIDQVMKRIDSQMKLESKREYASFILDNSKDIYETKQNLKDIFNKISVKYKGVKCPELSI